VTLSKVQMDQSDVKVDLNKVNSFIHLNCLYILNLVPYTNMADRFPSLDEFDSGKRIDYQQRYNR
jgi:hypothetical protein